MQSFERSQPFKCAFRCFFHGQARLPGTLPRQQFPGKHVGKGAARKELCCQRLTQEHLPGARPLPRPWGFMAYGAQGHAWPRKLNRIKEISTRVEPATEVFFLLFLFFFFFLTAHTVVNHRVHIVFAKGSPVCGFGAPLG